MLCANQTHLLKLLYNGLHSVHIFWEFSYLICPCAMPAPWRPPSPCCSSGCFCQTIRCGYGSSSQGLWLLTSFLSLSPALKRSWRGQQWHRYRPSAWWSVASQCTKRSAQRSVCCHSLKGYYPQHFPALQGDFRLIVIRKLWSNHANCAYLAYFVHNKSKPDANYV